MAMRTRSLFQLSICVLGLVLPSLARVVPLSAGSVLPLPSGNTGIASRHPGDVGIGSDPAVIFADDFESYSSASGLTSRWNEMFHTQRIATEPGTTFSGSKALEFNVPVTSSEVSNNAIKYVNPQQDV